jgi:hypothetical protein
MKKLLVTVIAISLIGMTPVHATSKAGSKCTKLNATTVVGNFKYTCIKSGSKLVWSKGAAIKKSIALKQGVCPPKSVSDKNPGITQVRANTLIGMSESDAENCANTLGWGFRVGQRDGEDFPMTMDFLVDRVTVTSMTGFITKVVVG